MTGLPDEVAPDLRDDVDAVPTEVVEIIDADDADDAVDVDEVRTEVVEADVVETRALDVDEDDDRAEDDDRPDAGTAAYGDGALFAVAPVGGVAALAGLPEPEVTGEARVDAATARLAELVDLPTSDHVGVYEDVHRRLQDALADAEVT